MHSISPLVYAGDPGLDSPYREFNVGRRRMQAPASCVVKVCLEHFLDEDNDYEHECFNLTS